MSQLADRTDFHVISAETALWTAMVQAIDGDAQEVSRTSDSCSTLNRNLKLGEAVRDQELVAAAKVGLSASFDKLQSLYSRQLFKTIVRITRNREDAEDALQNAFLQAYRSLHTFEGRSSFRSWLTRIGINCGLIILRKRRARARVFLDVPVEGGENRAIDLGLTDPGPDPEQICDQRQRYLNVISAMEKLEPDMRTALEIRLTHECSMQEIAEALNVSVAAVKSRIHRARARLTTTSVSKTQRDSSRWRATLRSSNREQPSMNCD